MSRPPYVMSDRQANRECVAMMIADCAPCPKEPRLLVSLGGSAVSVMVYDWKNGKVVPSVGVFKRKGKRFVNGGVELW